MQIRPYNGGPLEDTAAVLVRVRRRIIRRKLLLCYPERRTVRWSSRLAAEEIAGSMATAVATNDGDGDGVGKG